MTTESLTPNYQTNVTHYGAVGNGSSDDTLAFEEAIRDSRGCVFIPSGEYVVSELIVPFGISLVAEPGARLILTGEGLTFDSPGIYTFSTIENLTISPRGIRKFGVRAKGDFNVGLNQGRIAGLSLINTNFIAEPDKIHNNGYRTSDSDFFHTAIELNGIAFSSFNNCVFVGGYEVSNPSIASKGSAAVVLKGRSIRVTFSSTNIQSFQEGVRIDRVVAQ